jgi:putative FmdB family regulatory protein
MPTYEYACRACGHTFDVVQSMSEDALTQCPECGGELRKVFAPPVITFKGSGFYATDHGKKSKGTETTPAKKEGGSGADAAKKEGGSGADAAKKEPSTSGGSTASGSEGGSKAAGSGSGGGIPGSPSTSGEAT